MFRTQTGQTGKDAYRYEAAAIANELRELQARWDRLRETISNEAPEANVTSEVYVPSTGERSQDTRKLADVLRSLPLADVKRAGELISRADFQPVRVVETPAARVATADARTSGAKTVHTVYVDGSPVATRTSAQRYGYAICIWVTTLDDARTVKVTRWTNNAKAPGGSFALPIAFAEVNR